MLACRITERNSIVSNLSRILFHYPFIARFFFLLITKETTAARSECQSIIYYEYFPIFPIIETLLISFCPEYDPDIPNTVQPTSQIVKRVAVSCILDKDPLGRYKIDTYNVYIV